MAADAILIEGNHEAYCIHSTPCTALVRAVDFGFEWIGTHGDYSIKIDKLCHLNTNTVLLTCDNVTL